MKRSQLIIFGRNKKIAIALLNFSLWCSRYGGLSCVLSGFMNQVLNISVFRFSQANSSLIFLEGTKNVRKGAPPCNKELPRHHSLELKFVAGK